MLTSTRAQFLATAVCVGATTPVVVVAQARPVIRVGGLLTDIFAEPYYAAASGAFARQGLDIAVTTVDNGGVLLAAIAGGSLDIGVGDVVTFASAASKGVPVSIFAAGALYTSKDPIIVLCVAKSSPVRTAKDFEGKTIGVVTLGGMSSLGLKAWLTARGADVDQVKFVEMKAPSMAAALERGTVDGAVMAEPLIAAARDELRDAGRPLDGIASEFIISEFFATKGWLAADPARVKKTVAAIYDTARWANAHQDQTLQLLAQAAKYDIAQVKGMARTRYATALDASQIQPLIDVCVKYKVFDRPVQIADYIARV